MTKNCTSCGKGIKASSSVSDAEIDRQAEAMADVVMRGAASYIMSKNIKPTNEQLSAIIAEMKRGKSEALDRALKDGKEAMEAGMNSTAVATTEASLRLYGIECAKKVLG